MPAYSTIQIVAIVNVGSDAALGNRNIGIKTLSDFGSSLDGGDDDEIYCFFSLGVDCIS